MSATYYEVLDSSRPVESPTALSFKKPGVCTSKRIIIVIVIIAVVILILGLALGLGLRKSSPVVNKDGCKTFDTSKPSSRPRTKGETWLKQDCTLGEKPECPSGYSRPPLLVISMDGFRADYMKFNLTPVLEKLGKCGIHPTYMRPAFPSKTFPNHYSIVTGLYPESHGIIDNLMYDTEIKDVFTLAGKSKFDPRWWHGEPIWVSARKGGKTSATMFWPGSETKIDGTYPSMCFWYDKSVPFNMRVDKVLEWLDMPEDTRPDIITAYFDQPDGAGHQQGPNGDWVKGNLTVMNDLMGDLMDSLIQRKLDKCIDLIIVADHGMTPVSCDRVVNIQKPLAGLKVFTYDGTMGRVTSKYIAKGTKIVEQTDGAPVDELLHRLECVNYTTASDYHSRVYKKQDLPLRAHYAVSPRIEEIVVTAGDEWLLRGNFLRDYCNGGNHGYDNIFTSMRALFLAYGNSFRQNFIPEPFENIEVYNLMADILDIPHAPNNGTDGRLQEVLRNPPAFPSPPSAASDYISVDFPDQEERDRRRDSSDCKCSDLPKPVDELDLHLNLSDDERQSSLKRHLPTGVPVLGLKNVTVWQYVQEAYVSAYSKDHRMPLWNAYTLTSPVNANGTVADCARVDVRLPPEGSTKCADYTNKTERVSASYLFPSGFSSNEDVEMDAQISTNIVPMYDDFREGAWQHVLETVVDYQRKYQTITVMAGPIFDFDYNGIYDTPSSFKQFVSGGVVPLPTHYYVVLTKCQVTGKDPCPKDKQDIMGLILRHKPTMGNCWEKIDSTGFKYLQNVVARARDVELVTGLSLLGDMDGTSRVKLATQLTLGLWSRERWLDDDECEVVREPDCPAGYTTPPVLLISLDGFRPDYLQRNMTPVLEKIGRCGVSTPFLLPQYPSITFPNHYSIATGLYPESHGIIDNTMYDQVLKEKFYLGSPNTANPKWWGGEPVWNTVIKDNKTSMVFFWPGSDVEIGGMRPTRYVDYDGDIPYSKRIETVLQWLKGAEGIYPDFLMLYLEKVDKAGHTGGPDSLEVTDALAEVNGYLEDLMDGLKRNHLDKCVNILITSDHGMSDISCERSVRMKDFTDDMMNGKFYSYNGAAGRLSNQYTLKGSYVPVPENERVPVDVFLQRMSCKTPHMKVYKTAELPKRYHYANNDRIENITMVLNDTWLINYDKSWCPIKGQHGWDAWTYESMRAFFQAYGPGFKSEYNADPFELIELYNLITKMVGVEGAPNNGTEGSLYHLLRDPPVLPAGKNYLQYDIPEYPSNGDYEQRANATDCTCQKPEDNSIEEYDERLKLDLSKQKLLETHHLPSGRPFGDLASLYLLYHEDYISAYSSNHSMPLWTAFTLPPTKGANFTSFHCLRPDVRLDSEYQPRCSDLKSSEFLTNHLFPPGFASSQDALFDTLLLTNVVPMMPNFATGVWQNLTSMLQRWADETGPIQVIAGPVFDYNADGLRDDITNTTVKLGESNIPIPSHFFVIALHCPAERADGCQDMNYDTQAFVVEHRSNVTNCQSYEDYTFDNMARLRDVELLTGFEFLTANQTQLSIQTRVKPPRNVGFQA